MLRLIRVLLVLLPLVMALAGCSSSSGTTESGRGGRGNSIGLSRPALPENISAGRRAVVNESYRWLGVPYRYAGNTTRGVDCSGLVGAIFKKFRLTLPRRASELFHKGRGVSRGDLQPADLVFFSNTAGPGISHVGIYVGEDRFVHSSTRAGVVISSLEDSYYSRHYAGARMLIK
jgi:cell wall-associated NlpC family hydrolase